MNREEIRKKIEFFEREILLLKEDLETREKEIALSKRFPVGTYFKYKNYPTIGRITDIYGNDENDYEFGLRFLSNDDEDHPVNQRYYGVEEFEDIIKNIETISQMDFEMYAEDIIEEMMGYFDI